MSSFCHLTWNVPDCEVWAGSLQGLPQVPPMRLGSKFREPILLKHRICALHPSCISEPLRQGRVSPKSTAFGHRSKQVDVGLTLHQDTQ